MRIIDRRIIQSPGPRPTTPTGRTSVVASAERSAGLPPDLLHAAGGRLAEISLIYAAVFLIQHVVLQLVMPAGELMQHTALDAPWGRIVTVFVAISLVVAWVAGTGRIPPEFVPDLGLVYMVFGAVGIEAGLLWTPRGATPEMLGLSWTTVWLAMFPLVVPTTPGKTLVAALIAASLRPLAVLILVARGFPMPSAAGFVMILFPNAIGVLLAVVGTHVIFQLGRDVSRARQLGSYALVEPLGRGGMGEVWRAEHQMLARPAAIKLIRPESLGQAEPEARRQLIRRFEREARATAVLSSPHTVQVHDFGSTEDDTFYYVMELLRGLDADQLVQRFGPVPPARAAHILRQVCESLAEAHAEGLIHRDIKPANVYLCRRGLVHDFVKVLDFGLVKAAAGTGQGETVLTQENMATGTPAFMPPEIALGEGHVDGRTDLYALGCLGYWLVTGTFVFDRGNAMQIMLAHAQQAPEPPSRRTEQAIPDAFEALLMQCLEKDPARRPASADTLRRDLDALAFDQPWDRDSAERWWRTNVPDLT